MHPDRGVLLTHRRSDVISTIPDNPNILLANPLLPMTPPGTRCTTSLHGILPVLRTCYVYNYIYIRSYGPVHLFFRYDHHKHCTAASRDRPFSHHRSDFSAIIVISSYVLGNVSDWIWLTISDFIRLNCFSIWLDLIVVSIWSDTIVFYSIRLNCFYFIRLTSNKLFFDPSHTIRITFQSGLGECHIGQGVSKILQRWDRRIFHNSDDLNFV